MTPGCLSKHELPGDGGGAPSGPPGPPDHASADHEALQRFVETAAPAALAEVIQRYAGLVHGVAQRRTGQHEQAQEVAQNVFAALARKAPALLRARTPPAAWLHRAAVLESAHAQRKERSRQRMMKKFALHAELVSPPEPAPLPDSVLPVLDEALDRLPRADRELLLARYFADRSYRDIAADTGRSEAALMQQHHRALEKLSRFFRQRGIAASSAALAAGLGTPLASAAPAGFSAATVAAAAGAATAPTLALSTSLQLTLAMHTKTQIALAAAAACLVAGTGSFFAGRAEGKARAEHRLAQTQGSAFAEGSSAAAKPFSTPGAFLAVPAEALPQDIAGKLAKASADWRAATDEKERTQAFSIIGALTADEIPTARAFLESIREENALFLGLSEKVLPLWAAHQPEAALAWLTEHLPRPRRQKIMERILEEWGGRDHAAALAWWRRVMDSLDFPVAENAFSKFDQMVFSGWARSDPGGLIAALRDENDSTRQEYQGEAEDALMLVAADPNMRPELIKALSALPSDAEKMTFYLKSVGPLMVIDSATMREMALAFPLEKKENRDDLLVMTAFAPMLISGDENEAIAWLRQHMEASAIRPSFERLLAGTVGDLPKEAFQQKIDEFLPPPVIERIRKAIDANLPQ